MKREEMHYIEYGFFYVILFFILREWLLPVIELTQTSKLELMLAFVAICCLLNVLEIHLGISIVIKCLYIAWFLVYVYTEGAFLSMDSIAFLWQDLRANFAVIWLGNFEQVTSPFRSLLFFFLIWMFIYLIDYWLKVRMTVFYFFVLTVFFIATLDTFTAYDGTFAIVKVVLLGLVMTAFLYMKRLIVQTGTAFPLYKYMSYMLPVVLAITVAGVVAILLPKAEPQWADPVPYIKSLSEGSGGPPGEKVSKVGLGDDDSQLGGSFEADDTVVFTVHADSKQYWRVEMKDFYTSKGWETTLYGNVVSSLRPENVPLSIPPNAEGEIKVAKVFSQSERNYMLQAYGTQSYIYQEGNVDLHMNFETERLSTFVMNSDTEHVLSEYEIMYRSPMYSYTELKQPITDWTNWSADTQFLQLPAELPQRVRDLALDITAGTESQYDKAREIEQYFRRNGFWYDTENVAVPKAEQDYVDQFLFETKRGYCDNFSTAMVVMLRANDIPARWVKGFANGSETGRSEDGQRIFEVENNDAHSWVEAYIDGIGWMTFEPTIGFSAPSQIDYDLETTPEVTPEQLQEQEQDRTVREETETEAVKKAQERSFVWLYVLLGVVAVVAVIAFIRRRKWLPKVHIANQRRKAENQEAVQSAYKVLLKQLEYEGLVRRQDETLANFAVRVDNYFGTTDMSKVTDVYEKSIYSKNADEFSYDKIKESWEYLINRTTG